jgi:hypothetical protein
MVDVHGSQNAAVAIPVGDAKNSPDSSWTHCVSSIIGQPYSRTSKDSPPTFGLEPFDFGSGEPDPSIHFPLSVQERSDYYYCMRPRSLYIGISKLPERDDMPESTGDKLEKAISAVAQAVQDHYGPTATGIRVDLAANGQHAFRIPLTDDVYPAAGEVLGPPLAQSPRHPNPA